MQMARNPTMEEWGVLRPGQYLIHARDTKYCDAFKQIIDDSGIKRLPLPAKSPNLSAIGLNTSYQRRMSFFTLRGQTAQKYANRHRS